MCIYLGLQRALYSLQHRPLQVKNTLMNCRNSCRSASWRFRVLKTRGNPDFFTGKVKEHHLKCGLWLEHMWTYHMISGFINDSLGFNWGVLQWDSTDPFRPIHLFTYFLSAYVTGHSKWCSPKLIWLLARWTQWLIVDISTVFMGFMNQQTSLSGLWSLRPLSQASPTKNWNQQKLGAMRCVYGTGGGAINWDITQIVLWY